MPTTSHRNPASTHDRHHQIVQEAESLVQRLAHSPLGEEAQALMGKLREALAELQATAQETQKQVKSGLRATEHAVKKHPFRSVGIALGAGFAIGFLTKRFYRKSA